MMKIQILSALTMFLFTSYCFAGSIIKTHYGRFNIFNKSSTTVLSAPHGTYDINTGEIVSSVCLRVDISCVIATGFTPKGTRINVNRPTEGVGIKSTKEPKTARAIKTYNTFKKYVSSVAKPSLELYIEVHGSGVNGIEVALHNMSSREARLIKNIINDEWTKLSKTLIPIKVQGVDKIKMVGNAVKRFGIVGDLQPKFIAFEFSRSLRNNQDVLSDFLINSIKRINDAI